MSYGVVLQKELQIPHDFAQNILYPIECIVFKDELYTFDESRKHHQIL
jgi:hypothetical protein